MADPTDKEFKELVSQVKKSMNELKKHELIRVKHWIQKLQMPVNNAVWKQNRNFYLKIMLQMILDGQLLSPFNQTPPEGALPKLTLYDIPYPIRSKFNTQNDRKQNRRTPSCHKTQSHSRKNSQNSCSIKGTLLNRRNSTSFSLKQNQKVMQHKKKINFEGSSLFADNCDENQDISNRSFFQATLKANTMKTDQNFVSQLDFLNSTHQCSRKNAIHFGHRSKPSSSTHEDSEDLESNKRGLGILKKAIKLLGEQYQQFSGQITYKELVEEIVRIGEKYGQNMKQIDLNIAQQSNEYKFSTKYAEDSPYLDYTMRIKENFTQSDHNYKEFMCYLRNLPR